MASDTFLAYLDELSGGKISQPQKELAAMEAEIEAMDAEIEALDATIAALKKQFKSIIIKLFAKGNSLKEISDTLDISEKEVIEFLEN
ncbi:MAG: hypothetical protein LBT38_07400 [Deltaproteobacteria bacterium]|jgi:DNA-directed RNA polymerase specialized sigma24 family protein|nr:hypothetical protein [Deltaproteobacteria bacterium]